MIGKLTSKQLLILAAVRHLQPCGIPQAARLLNKPEATVNTICYGSNYGGRTGYLGLIKRGYLTSPYNRQRNTITLTEAGQAALQNIALIRENGTVRIGKVEAK